MKHKSLDMTEEGENKRLNGVSSIGITQNGKKYKMTGDYWGREIHLLGANRHSDELEYYLGEKVLQSPTVLAKVVFCDRKMIVVNRM